MRLLSLVLIGVACFGQGREKVGEAGVFDHYLLAMSWSPAYCASGTRTVNANEPQCGGERAYAFVLHGLWPQYDNGRWPQFCSEEKGLADGRKMLDIMPSMGLVRHEWARHGTCSGLGAEGYFALARKAFGGVRIPAEYEGLSKWLVVSPGEVKRAFLKANPQLKAEGVAVQCSSNYLSEVRVCLDRELRPVACKGQRECRATEVRMPPVR